jgi:hypothetical protein
VTILNGEKPDVRPVTKLELVINLEEVSVRAVINESSPMCRATPSADARWAAHQGLPKRRGHGCVPPTLTT